MGRDASGGSALGALAGNALLALLGVAVGVALLEVGARLRYDRPWYDLLTEAQTLTRRTDYRQNAFGLRDDEYPSPPPPGHRRVLFLGDSFTFGLSVFDETAIFPERVEARLNATPPVPGATRIDVLNGGIPGSLTRDWLRLYREVAPVFQPDVVVPVFFLRDGTETGSIPDFFGDVHQEITLRNRASSLYRRSYLYRRYRDNLDRQEVASCYTREFRKAYFGSDRRTKEWRAAQRNLIWIRDDARARGAAVGFVVFPVLVDLGAGYPFERLCDYLSAWGQANELPTLNLLEAFRGERAAELWVSTYDQHPNARGHALAAEALTPFVADLLRDAERRRRR